MWVVTSLYEIFILNQIQEKCLDANELHFIACGPRESVQQSSSGCILVGVYANLESNFNGISRAPDCLLSICRTPADLLSKLYNK